MTKYTYHYSKISTPQNQPIPGSAQVQNSAGGFSFQVDDFTRLDRFLILGSEGGSYYTTEQKLTVENATCVERCLDQDYKKAIDRIVEISHEGRAPKNDPALFALAIAAGHKNPDARRYALDALPKVARIGTHLFSFVDSVQHFRGWGRSLRKAVARWYSMPAQKLALQAVKYQQREGWSHRDLLRLSHPEPETELHQTLFHYITQGRINDLTDVENVPEPLQLVWAFERAKQTSDVNELIKLITDYRLPHECVPNEVKKDPKIWEAILVDMPVGAMVRNLGRMSSIGLLTPGSHAAGVVSERLHNQELIQKSRLHPIALLSANLTYKAGHGKKGKLTWNPVHTVCDALEDAFYLAFRNVEPTGRPTLLALDVSGSMIWGQCAGINGLTPAMGAAAMALVTARTEPNYQIMGFATSFRDLKVTAKDTLESALRKTSKLSFGGTDCAQPMLWSLQNGYKFENFAVYTDSETWAGSMHPSQALKRLRKTGVPAKLVVVGMVGNRFSIADPNDAGMLDVVGFDTAAPAIMTDFFRQ